MQYLQHHHQRQVSDYNSPKHVWGICWAPRNVLETTNKNSIFHKICPICQKGFQIVNIKLSRYGSKHNHFFSVTWARHKLCGSISQSFDKISTWNSHHKRVIGFCTPPPIFIALTSLLATWRTLERGRVGDFCDSECDKNTLITFMGPQRCGAPKNAPTSGAHGDVVRARRTL